MFPSSILSPVPFDTWAIDIMGSFPPSKGHIQYLLVDVDYIIKWVEAKVVAHITAQVCRKFLHEHIVTRFGIPRVLITNNGSQFVDAEFEEYLSAYFIQHLISSVAYPQSIGQVKVTNRSLLQSLRKNLEDHKALWVEELPSILWAYRTVNQKPTGESPFCLTYGTEAYVPVEIGEPSLRLDSYGHLLNEQRLRTNLYFLEKRRGNSVINMANYKQKIAQYFKKVSPR